MIYLKILGLFLIAKTGLCLEVKGVNYLVNLINGDLMGSKLDDEDGMDTENPLSNGHSDFDFIEFVTYHDQKFCLCRNYVTASICREKSNARNVPIKIKCLANKGNGTVHVVTSAKEILSVLSPHGNYTKKQVEGNCALILFYAKSCFGSALVAPHFNALAKQFPNMKVAAVDALKFHSFNTEFGVVGLPTIMLFHQGRPTVKFNGTSSSVNTFIKFVTKHTGLKPKSSSAFVTSDDFAGPLSNKVVREPDRYLYLAWIFIIICGLYYFTKSKAYVQLEEMIKRNWRESEAQLEENS